MNVAELAQNLGGEAIAILATLSLIVWGAVKLIPLLNTKKADEKTIKSLSERTAKQNGILTKIMNEQQELNSQLKEVIQELKKHSEAIAVLKKTDEWLEKMVDKKEDRK